jgi:hypothetical protein
MCRGSYIRSDSAHAAKETKAFCLPGTQYPDTVFTQEEQFSLVFAFSRLVLSPRCGVVISATECGAPKYKGIQYYSNAKTAHRFRFRYSATVTR